MSLFHDEYGELEVGRVVAAASAAVVAAGLAAALAYGPPPATEAEVAEPVGVATDAALADWLSRTDGSELLLGLGDVELARLGTAVDRWCSEELGEGVAAVSVAGAPEHRTFGVAVTLDATLDGRTARLLCRPTGEGGWVVEELAGFAAGELSGGKPDGIQTESPLEAPGDAGPAAEPLPAEPAPAPEAGPMEMEMPPAPADGQAEGVAP